jgi:LPXTG-motif cell wall-anchored protein
MFADIPLEPRADVSVSGTPQWGMIVSGLAISAAVVILGIVLVRRRNKKD